MRLKFALLSGCIAVIIDDHVRVRIPQAKISIYKTSSSGHATAPMQSHDASTHRANNHALSTADMPDTESDGLHIEHRTGIQHLSLLQVEYEDMLPFHDFSLRLPQAMLYMLPEVLHQLVTDDYDKVCSTRWLPHGQQKHLTRLQHVLAWRQRPQPSVANLLACRPEDIQHTCTHVWNAPLLTHCPHAAGAHAVAPAMRGKPAVLGP